jgi:NADPH-dependent 2,4-dienoyl-CoA reductase/sulfur reductase-like enzyme
MIENKKAKNRLARREFLGTGATLAAGALGVSATKALSETAAEKAGNAQRPWLPQRWDYEADIVVAGLGFAGQSAAISAHDAGAKVIVLEKATKELSGGNSCCAVGGNSVWDDPKECYMDLRHAGQDVPDELVQTMVDALSIPGKRNVLNWLKKLGIETTSGGKSTKKTPALNRRRDGNSLICLFFYRS